MGAKWPTDDQALIIDSGGKKVNDLKHQKRYFIQIFLTAFQYFKKWLKINETKDISRIIIRACNDIACS